MVIASIDFKDKKVVQLLQGKDLVLERDNPEELAEEFNKYGELAIIDLDAALRNTNPDGTTVNTEIIKSLLRKASVRVGGGINNPKWAKKLISLGAEKVIIGSSVFTMPDGSKGINYDFLESMVKAIGKDRIIISVDSREGKISIKGWTENTSIDLIEAAKAVSPYCSELLFTYVEREGTLTGIDLELVKSLRKAVDCRLVVAGGVSSVEEVAELEKLNCDVQLGMALYKGLVSLKDCFTACLDWEKANGLIPVIAQELNGEVLMLGYANKEAIEKSFDTGKLTFYSRTRKSLWTKGEISGNSFELVKMRVDCDRDTILATVKPKGPACHTGSWTCFKTTAEKKYSMEYLSSVIRDRFKNPSPSSYTASLNDVRVREKIMEEAEELCEAKGIDEVTWEVADLLYFMSVLMHKEKVNWQDVLDELDLRNKK